MPKNLAAIALVSFLFFISKVQAQSNELDSIKALLQSHQQQDTARVKLLIDAADASITTDINAGLPLIQEALELSRAISFERGKGQALNALCTSYLLKGKLDSALNASSKAEKVLLAISDRQNLTVTYGNMARIYSIKGDHDKALAIQLKNIDLIKDNPPSSKKASFYFYAGKFCQALGKIEETKTYFEIALGIAKSCDFDTGVAIAESSLATLYEQLEEYQEAIQMLNKSLAYYESQGQSVNVAASYMSLAKCYAGLEKYEQAIVKNTKAITIYESQKNLKTLRLAFELQSQYLENLDRYKEANFYLKKYRAAQDSLFSTDKVKLIEELHAKYETEKKEAEIAALSQTAIIQNLKLEQKNLAISIAGVLVLLIGGLVFFVTRQKSLKSSQSQMELEQRFLRSQLNPHFISNALLAVQNFMIKNQSEMAVTYLSKFSKLMRETLENSRKEFIPLEDELAMLTNFMDVHKMRLNDTFEYELHVSGDIDPEVDTIPPMFVQPFVENAIEHGISQAEGKGKIDLYFEKEEEYISIVIKDNGGGYAQSNTQGKDHISLSTIIIRERMEIFNKTLKRKIQLILADVKSDDGKTLGAQVELKVPFGYV
ncbi:MAG: tetratricopeptide repeat protein [Reichenbachiella sp.]|uniref:tetratricopeptide repeat-containing sensor histidine kinase n=1 Tax=Reichenbachiella sp. TaxID=2184521 RepID=UPI003296E8B5